MLPGFFGLLHLDFSESANSCVTAKSRKSTANLGNGENLSQSLNRRPLSALHLCAKPVNALIWSILWENRYERDSVAEGVGFEPTVTFQPRRFSRPVPSTARPPLRCLDRVRP